MAKAYSYIRFSSVRQEVGDSLRRQEKLAVDYASAHNLELDTRSYRDLGVSAFRGKNATEGSLKMFLDAVSEGKIEAGSYLLVESLDRISRDEVPEALELLLSVVRKGILIVTLMDQKVYSRASIRADHGISLIISISLMSRAHEESATKSTRVRAAWKQKRASGEILTAMAPAWLTLSADRTRWILDKKKVETVERIFELALEGNGAPAIARELNRVKVPTMKSAERWTFGTVAAVLKNQAVIGRFTPKKAIAEPKDDYYPTIIRASDFRLVQDGMASRQWIGGRNSETIRNLFAGYSLCYVCRSKMRIVGSNERHTYLKCLASYSNSGCKEGRFPYLAAEKGILYRMSEDLSHIMAAREKAENPLPALQLKRDDLKSRISKLTAALEIVEDVAELSLRLNTLQTELTKVESELAVATEPGDLPPDRGDMRMLLGYFDGDAGPMPIELRRRVQVFLRQIVEEVLFGCDEKGGRPTAIVNFRPNIDWGSLYVDVTPYREQVGGNRRKIAKQS